MLLILQLMTGCMRKASFLIFLCLVLCKPTLTLINKAAFTTARSELYVREKPKTSSRKVALLKLNTRVLVKAYSDHSIKLFGKKARWALINFEKEMVGSSLDFWQIRPLKIKAYMNLLRILTEGLICIAKSIH